MDHYLDRDLGWLRFNERVLFQAEDERVPLLERVRFIEIFQSNLNEFYMKRVGGLQQKKFANIPILSASGLSAGDRLTNIRHQVLYLFERVEKLLTKSILPQLQENNIHLFAWEELNSQQQRWCQEFFRNRIFPVVTPMVVDQGHPFPLLSNLSTSLAAIIRAPGEAESLFARVKLPTYLPEWIQVEDKRVKGDIVFVHLIDIIKAHFQDLFPKMEIEAIMPFKVTRNADFETDEDDADDLLDLIQAEIKNRKFSEVVRLEHGPQPNRWLLEFLKEHLDITDDEILPFPLELRFRDLNPLPELNIPELRFTPWSPVNPMLFGQEEEMPVFQVLKTREVLVHHPYESFSATVEKFLQSAARDPSVVTIKLTLYRTNRDSSIVKTLIEAAESGKQVVCLVELKARFDEERNIRWAQELEKAGVHVIYGMVGLKIHSKIALVVRQEGQDFRLYCHVGTGNYNSTTASLYTDLGLFTSNSEITNEIVEVFHFLTGRSLKADYRNLLVSPSLMKNRFLELIAQERENALKGMPSGIVAKMNSLEDKEVIDALYECSCAGVSIHLIVRGFCCLRPQVKDLSENIRVLSIVGPFLEHARIFHFRAGAPTPEEGLFYIGSGDWMSRNLQRRVEVAVPIKDLPMRKRLWNILSLQLSDNRLAWDMKEDGSYCLRVPPSPEGEIHCQKLLMDQARQRLALASGDESGNNFGNESGGS